MKLLIVCLSLLFSSRLLAEPLFDVHLHYNDEDAEQFTPEQIMTKLERNAIQHALVTSIPPELAIQLHQQAPKRILPILGVYRTVRDKESWMHNANLPARIEQQLEQHEWWAIGELHLFANDRHSPVFSRIIKLAQDHNLPLLLHADPAVIDTLYEQAPQQPVIWAHAGTFPYPDLLADYLTRYPALRVDLSVRNARIAPNGQLHDDWVELFIQFPDRFMIGVDTFSVAQWQRFDETVENTREWLAQLPADVARRIAFQNAADLLIKTEIHQ